MKTRIRAERQMWTDGIALSMMLEHGNKCSFAEPVIFTGRSAGERVGPFIELEMTAAQLLMDELWGCGLRPSEGSGSAGSLAATERHLADMKTLAFHALKVQP